MSQGSNTGPETSYNENITIFPSMHTASHVNAEENI
jgi:hypothetical protein